MKKYTQYIIAAFLLIAGVGIGWILKPSSSNDHQHDHNATVTPAASSEIWTCSMHPQIRQNEPGICPICEMDLITLDSDNSSDDPTILRMSASAAKLAQVTTMTVGGSNETTNTESGKIQVEGTVELDDRTINVQSSHVAGRIESMAVTFEGQYISKGTKVATIYSTELLQASQELLTAAKLENRVAGVTDASRQKLKNWKITDAQIQEILDSGSPIETIPIYAEQSGYILERKKKLGDYVSQGAPLYTIGSTSSVWLIFNVYESDMAAIKRGQQISFTAPAIGGADRTARISYIDPLLDPQTRTAKVRASFANQSNLLKPGMLLKGHIINSASIASSDNPEITVPNSAILWTGERSVVYVQLPDYDTPTYQYREVTIGDRRGDYTVISDGIERGDQVVVNGAFAIDAAAQLNNNMSMMNRDVKIKKEASTGAVPNFVEDTPEEFKDQLDAVTVKYISLKDALVATDEAQADAMASELLQALDTPDMSLLAGEAHEYWMSQLDILRAHTERIIEIEDIESDRDQFDFVSTAMINALRAFGTNGSAYYVQYCPMAKDYEGASWIASEEQIQNPYFGDKMMKCGTVKLEL